MMKDIGSSGTNNRSLLRSSGADNIMLFYKQRTPNGAYIPYDGYLILIIFTTAVVAFKLMN